MLGVIPTLIAVVMATFLPVSRGTESLARTFVPSRLAFATSTFARAAA